MCQVDEQSDYQEERGQHEQLALHGNEVAMAKITHQAGAYARQCEQVLDHHDSGDHLGESEADH